MGRKVLCILIDFGSTQNFINSRIARKLGCVMEYIHELKVLTANGMELQCNERCRKCPWAMQGQNFEADVLSLPLDNYDLVLAVQWLVELGDIIWNFKKLQMRFTKDGKEHVLQGEQMAHNTILTVSEEKMNKVLSKKAQVAMVHCFNQQVSCSNQEEVAKEKVYTIPIALQKVLLSFKDIFAEPIGLPPCRDQDHKIILKERAEAINCRPYRYGTLQKDVIERMTQDMLESGIIQNSNSAFSSPVVLVKKKDNS